MFDDQDILMENNIIGYLSFIKASEMISEDNFIEMSNLDSNQWYKIKEYLKDHNYITTKNEKIIFKSMEKLIDEEISIDDFLIAGALKTLNSGSTDELAKLLNMKIDKIEHLLHRNNLRNYVNLELQFDLTKKYGRRLLFRYNGISDLLIGYYREKINLSSKKQSEKEIFGIRNYWNKVIVILGLLGLKQSLKVDTEIADIFMDSISPVFSELVDVQEIKKIVVLANLMKGVNVNYDDNWISGNINYNLRSDLSKFIDENDFENVEPIIKIIKSKSRIPFNYLVNQVNQQIKNLPSCDTLAHLSECYMRNLFDGIIDLDNNLIINQINDKDNESKFGLNYNQKVLLGLLSSRQNLKIENIQKVIPWGDNRIRNEVSKIANSGQIKIEIARNAKLIFDKLPTIPQLTQTAHLPIIDRILLGNLIYNSNFDIDTIIDSLGIKRNQMFRQIYFLVGSGLIHLKIKDEVISNINLKVKTSKHLLKLKYPKKIETVLFDLQRDSLTINIKKYCTDQSITFQDLMNYIYLFSIDQLIDTFEIVKNNLIYELVGEKDYFNCNNCDWKIPIDAEICPNCQITVIYCSICRAKILYGEITSECEHCLTKSHKNHLIQWLTIQPDCPVCKQRISIVNGRSI